MCGKLKNARLQLFHNSLGQFFKIYTHERLLFKLNCKGKLEKLSLPDNVTNGNSFKSSDGIFSTVALSRLTAVTFSVRLSVPFPEASSQVSLEP